MKLFWIASTKCIHVEVVLIVSRVVWGRYVIMFMMCSTVGVDVSIFKKSNFEIAYLRSILPEFYTILLIIKKHGVEFLVLWSPSFRNILIGQADPVCYGWPTA